MMAAAPTARRTVQPSRRAPMGRRIWGVIRDLLSLGYGSSRFVLDEDGKLRHESTVYTVKPRLGEDPFDFVERLCVDYKVRGKEDSIDLVSDVQGRISHAKVTIKS